MGEGGEGGALEESFMKEVIKALWTWVDAKRSSMNGVWDDSRRLLKIWNSREPQATLSALPMTQRKPFSFHLTLHRFAAAAMREYMQDGNVCDLSNIIDGVVAEASEGKMDDDDNANHSATFYQDLIEYPLITLSRTAQIKVGIWNRNNCGVRDQVMNYGEPPFCRSMRDLDLLIFQVGARRYCDLKGETRSFVNLMLHRFGIWDWTLNENEAFSWDRSSPQQDQEKEDCRGMFDEFLWFLVMFVSELPRHQGEGVKESKFFDVMEEEKEEGKGEEKEEKKGGEDKEEVVRSKVRVLAKVKADVRKEVVHRLAVGGQTHSKLTEIYGLMSPREIKVVKEVGGDDGKILDDILKEVAVNKLGQGLDPNKWHLKPEAWNEYDPCFYHLNERGHQAAAANRAEKWGRGGNKGNQRICKPLARVAKGWEGFRKRMFWDETLRAVLWKVVWGNLGGGRERLERQSETALARVIQFLSLGLGAMEEEGMEGEDWKDWVFKTDGIGCTGGMVGGPGMYQILRDGRNGMDVNDVAIKKGIEWIIESVGVAKDEEKEVEEGKEESKEAERERRKKEARAKAMERMNSNARNFMVDMDIDMDEDDKIDRDAREGKGADRGGDRRFVEREEEKCIICNEFGNDRVMLYCCNIKASTVLTGGRVHIGKSCGTFRDGRLVNAHLSMCGHKMHAECSKLWDETNEELECPLCKAPCNAGVVDLEEVKEENVEGAWNEDHGIEGFDEVHRLWKESSGIRRRGRHDEFETDSVKGIYKLQKKVVEVKQKMDRKR